MENRKNLSIIVILIAIVIMILLVMNVNSYARTLNVMGQVEFNPPCDTMTGNGDAMNDDPPEHADYIMGGEVSTTITPCNFAMIKESKMNKEHCTKTLNVMGQLVLPVPCENQ